MEVRAGYKWTEVGVIPEDWDVRALGDVGEALIGLTYKPSDVREHGTLVLRSSNIQNDVLAFHDNVFVGTEIPERIKVRSGDVLICVRNGSRALIGKSVLLDERMAGMTFGAFMAIYRSEIGTLASYYFQSEIVKRQINEHLGATINQITNKSLKSFRIPLPPSDTEQRAIADALSNMDALLDGLDRLIAKKRDLKQAAMQQLLTGQTRLPGFSGEWEVKRLGNLLRSGPENGYSGQSSDSPWGTPTLSLAATSSGRLVLNPDTVKYLNRRIPRGSPLFLEPGDVLVQRSNTADLVGTTAMFDGPDGTYVYPDLMMRLRFMTPVTGAWFWRYANSAGGRAYFRSVAAGSTGSMPKISGVALREMPVPLPSVAEQSAITEVLFDMDSELAALESRRDKTRALKQAMMQELLTGRTRLV